MLMAYVDAELGEADRMDVEQLLADDTQARETVERYRQTRSTIDQFADILDEPVPPQLVNTIRQYDQQANVIELPDQMNTGPRWFAIAASLVVGVGLGIAGTNYLAVMPSEDTALTATNKVAQLSDALEAMKIEKNTAEKSIEISENNTSEAMKVAAAAKSKVDALSQALKISQAEKKQAQEQVLAANRETPAPLLVKEIEGIFPFKLVSEAIGNGYGLSAEAQKVILVELNKEDVPITYASSFSKLIRKSTGNDLTSRASQYETLGDVQSGKMPTEETSGNTHEVLGEFTYSGKTCHLIKFKTPNLSEASAFVACREGTGKWSIVQGE